MFGDISPAVTLEITGVRIITMTAHVNFWAGTPQHLLQCQDRLCNLIFFCLYLLRDILDIEKSLDIKVAMTDILIVNKNHMGF
jgi:hypothetical protein